MSINKVWQTFLRPSADLRIQFLRPAVVALAVGAALLANSTFAAFLYRYDGDSLVTGAAGIAEPDGLMFPTLDGTWLHNWDNPPEAPAFNESDAWDESAIGGVLGAGNAPGGANLLNGDGSLDDNYLRVQETGEPRDHGYTDPSNRKIFFHRYMSQDGVPTSAPVLDNGFELEFRARLATTGVLDELHPDNNPGGAGPQPFPAGGDGYPIHDSGKGMVGVMQHATGGQSHWLSFSLALESDHASFAGQFGGGGALVMNNLVATSRSGNVDSGDGGTPTPVRNFVPVDVTQWHTYNVKIAPDGVIGTHTVAVSVDGGLPTLFNVTAGSAGSDDVGSQNALTLGLGNTGQSGAFDLDYVAYNIPEPTSLALVGLALAGLAAMRRRA